MRLIKIKLRDMNKTWIMPPILLNNDKPISSLVDIDKLTFEQSKIIESSVLKGEIFLYDEGDRRVPSLKNAKVVVYGDVSIDDEEDESNDIIPEVIGVTCNFDDEEEQEDEEDDIIITEEDKVQATILLKRNGNTVTKALRKHSYGFGFLHACLSLEEKNKNRTSVIKALNSLIQEMT